MYYFIVLNTILEKKSFFPPRFVMCLYQFSHEVPITSNCILWIIITISFATKLLIEVEVSLNCYFINIFRHVMTTQRREISMLNNLSVFLL